ncbi:MAG: hypothetical protein KGL39_37470 [Patescibacteria group bacterium]|nr:hypothetical protein [Patescibacteria group bacterium]
MISQYDRNAIMRTLNNLRIAAIRPATGLGGVNVDLSAYMDADDEARALAELLREHDRLQSECFRLEQYKRMAGYA